MSGQMKSMPATSSPTTRAAISAISTLSGCASRVRSIDVPPVDMLPVSASLTRWPFGGTPSSSKPWCLTSSSAAASTLIRVRTFSWPMPRRGSAFVSSTSSRTVRLPSPTTLGRHALGDRRDLAADDQAAVVVAGDERLDDEVAGAALAAAPVERRADVVFRAQIELDAAAMVAVERLDDAREADRAWRPRSWPRPTGRPPTSARAGRPSRAGGWSGSCRSRCRRRWPTSASSSSRGCAAGGRPGRAGRATARSRRRNGMSREAASSRIAWVDGPNAWRSARRMRLSSSSM